MKNLNKLIIYKDRIEKLLLDNHIVEESNYGFFIKDELICLYVKCDKNFTLIYLAKYFICDENGSQYFLKRRDLLKYEKFDKNLKKISNIKFILNEFLC